MASASSPWRSAFGVHPVHEAPPQFLHIRPRAHHVLKPALGLAQFALHFAQLPLRIVEDAEMRGRDATHGQRLQPPHGGMPFLKMQLRGRHRDSQIRVSGNAHTANVAGETDVLKQVGMMVLGVTGRVDGHEAQGADLAPPDRH